MLTYYTGLLYTYIQHRNRHAEWKLITITTQVAYALD